MKRVDNLRKVFTPSVKVFLTISFLLAWVLFLVPRFWIGEGETTRTITRLAAWSAAMWAPGLAAIIATRWTENKKLSSLRLGRLGKGRFYFWAWLLPILIVLAAGLLTWAGGLGAPRATLPWEDLDPQLTPPSSLTAGQLISLQVAAGLFIGPLINTLFAVGEELGWRGFLLPRLLPLGQTQAILVSGIVWGAWHAPAIVQGHNYPGYPLLGTGMMILFTTLFGFVLSWLYFETRSPWAPALAHGTLNAAAGLPQLFLEVSNPLWGGTITSAAGFVVMGILILAFYVVKILPVLR